MISVCIHDDVEFITGQPYSGRSCGGFKKCNETTISVRFMRVVNTAGTGHVINGSGVHHPSALNILNAMYCITVENYWHLAPFTPHIKNVFYG